MLLINHLLQFGWTEPWSSNPLVRFNLAKSENWNASSKNLKKPFIFTHQQQKLNCTVERHVAWQPSVMNSSRWGQIPKKYDFFFLLRIFDQFYDFPLKSASKPRRQVHRVQTASTFTTSPFNKSKFVHVGTRHLHHRGVQPETSTNNRRLVLKWSRISQGYLLLLVESMPLNIKADLRANTGSAWYVWGNH